MSADEEYVLLGLRLGKHVHGLVDAYYGPQDLKDAVDDEPMVDAAELASDGATLRDSLEDGWLRDQVAACTVYARVLAGETISYTEEVEACYGVRPTRTDPSVYEAAHAELDALLPPGGSLVERREAWRRANRLEGDRLFPLLRELLADLRRRTIDAFGLPEGEEIDLEPVSGEPWWAFNYYLGRRRSRVVVNTDIPTSVQEAVHLAAHEVYPGHHTEHAWKEQLFVEERGELGEAILMVPTPQSLLSEGIAETGAEALLDEQGRADMAAIVARHGLTYDPELARAIELASEPLGTAGLDAALMIHEEGRSREEVQAHLERWGLATPERAAHQTDFVTDPTWRAYVVCYSAGERLCRAWVGGDRARFRRLLTEQIRVGELSSAV